jgi:hypothetical protein
MRDRDESALRCLPHVRPILLDQFSLGGMRFVLTAIATYTALYRAHGLKARASLGLVYRTIRRFTRLAFFAAIVYVLLSFATAAVLIAGVCGVPLLWWMMRGFDRLLGVSRPTEAANSAATS